MNIVSNNAIILVEIAVAVAVVGLIMLIYTTIQTYWLRYSNKIALEKQFDEQLLPEAGAVKKKKASLVLKWDRYWEKRLVDSGVNFMAANRNNAGKIIIYFDLGLLAVLTLLFQGSIFGALLVVVASNVVAAAALGFLAERKQKTLSGQVPEFLSAFGAANDASGSLQASLIQAIGTTPNELHEELKPMEDNLQAGGQLKTVLWDFYNSTSIEELRFFIACVIMADESGKDIKDQLAIIQGVVEARMEVTRHLDKAVASIMPTIWVASIFIPGMFLYTYLAQPIAKSFWFHSLLSWVLLLVVIALYLLGIWIAKHQVDNIKKL
jgi:Flp pilus assembly protein TadB